MNVLGDARVAECHYWSAGTVKCKHPVELFNIIFIEPEDRTQKGGVENSKLKIVLVCPSTRITGIQNE